MSGAKHLSNKCLIQSTSCWVIRPSCFTARHCRVTTYSLADISPRLAAMTNSDIPMPAIHGAGDAAGLGHPGILTIASFGDHVTVLTTKTRPKRLRMGGSDGATYSFLLKVGSHHICLRFFVSGDKHLVHVGA